MKKKKSTDKNICFMEMWYCTPDEERNLFHSFEQLKNADNIFDGYKFRKPENHDYAIVGEIKDHIISCKRYIYTDGEWVYHYGIQMDDSDKDLDEFINDEEKSLRSKYGFPSGVK